MSRTLYPVAGLHHLVGCELHARHQTEYGVLEHQHEHRGGGSQRSENGKRRLTYKLADTDYHADPHKNQLEHLEHTLYGIRPCILTARETRIKIVNENHHYAHYRPKDVERCEHIKPTHLIGIAPEKFRKQPAHHKRRGKLAYSTCEA